MLQKPSILHAILRKYLGPLALTAAIAPVLLLGNAAWAEKAKNDRAVRLLDTVPIPVVNPPNTTGGLYSFDISWVDQATETYYLADRSNAAVDIVDATSDILLLQLPGGFAGLMARP